MAGLWVMRIPDRNLALIESRIHRHVYTIQPLEENLFFVSPHLPPGGDELFIEFRRPLLEVFSAVFIFEREE